MTATATNVTPAAIHLRRAKEPPLDTAGPVLYRTSIEVRGGDWIFHPSQIVTAGPNMGAAGPFLYSPPGGAVNVYNRRCTTIVKMPSVVSVRTMNITF